MGWGGVGGEDVAGLCLGHCKRLLGEGTDLRRGSGW